MFSCFYSCLNKLDPLVDYKGQELSSQLMYAILLIGYFFAFMMGVLMHNLNYTLVIGIVTVVIAFLATVPGWSYFRRHPLKFKKAIKKKSE